MLCYPFTHIRVSSWVNEISTVVHLNLCMTLLTHAQAQTKLISQYIKKISKFACIWTPYDQEFKETREICGYVCSLTLAAGLGRRSNSGVLDTFSPVSLRRASGLLVPISRRRISGLFVRPISGGLLAEVGDALSFLKKLLMPAAILQMNSFKTKLEWDNFDFNFWAIFNIESISESKPLFIIQITLSVKVGSHQTTTKTAKLRSS